MTKPHSQSFHLRCRVLVSDWMFRCRLWSMHISTWRHGCVTAGHYWCLLFTLGCYFVLDKIWPSPKHVWNEIILSRFSGSPLARSLARRRSVRPLCVCVWRRAKEDRTSRFRQLQFRFHFLRFAVFKAFKVPLLLSDSIFSKVCMFLTLWDVDSVLCAD